MLRYVNVCEYVYICVCMFMYSPWFIVYSVKFYAVVNAEIFFIVLVKII